MKLARNGPLKMRLDCPDPHGSGGSTDNAETARRFLKAENCQHFVDIVQGTAEERDALFTLHKNIAVILRVINSKFRQVDIDSLQELCLKTYLEIVVKFPWASVTTSLHRLVGHSSERIKLNDGFGLGDCSEEGLETLHKLVRRFRERLAQKNSLVDNLKDVFGHLWVRSDPYIRSKKRTLMCSVCNEIGHTKPSCPSHHERRENNEYDQLVEELFLE
jgi:hypothetical protein